MWQQNLENQLKKQLVCAEHAEPTNMVQFKTSTCQLKVTSPQLHSWNFETAY